MCFGPFKKKPKPPTVEVDGFNLLSKEKVIEEHENAAGYHAYWADRQAEANNTIPNVGDVDWHYYWIDVHLSGKWYLEH